MKKAIYLSLLCLFLGTTSSFAEDIKDPFESVNRVVFKFNDKLDQWIIEPIAQKYKDTAPGPVYIGIHNFFRHIKYPIYLVSDLLQFKFKQAARRTSRFIVNTTIGVGGFVDFAKRIGYEHHPEDFGTALAYYGVSPGPYIVLPFIGPSDLRDAIGLGFDATLYPGSYLKATGLTQTEQYAVGSAIVTVDFISQRARLIETLRTGREGSLDYYSFMKSTFHQYRQNEIYDDNPPDGDEFMEDEEFFEDEISE